MTTRPEQTLAGACCTGTGIKPSGGIGLEEIVAEEKESSEAERAVFSLKQTT